MADLKVSQETDLGLGGIDGSVEYRVVKSGSTYKQNYNDLLDWINNSIAIPTLQEVLTAGNTTDNNNFYVGLVSGDQTGFSNIGIGVGALASYAGGGGSVANSIGIGEYAGQSTNFNGIAMGYFAGQGMDITNSVIAIGSNSFRNGSNQSGIAIGGNAGYFQKKIDGNPTYNTINIGVQAGQYSGGDNNVFIGVLAGSGASDSYNVAIGSDAGNSNTGANSIAIGKYAGYGNSGSSNFAIGDHAGYYNSGNECFFAGSYAGYDIESYNHPNTASSVIGIGYQSAGGNSQNNVIALGDYAGYLNDSGESFYAGLNSGYGLSGYGNNAIGSGTLNSASGNYNVAIGMYAGQFNIGDNSVFIGTSAGDSCSASSVLALGSGAGANNQAANVTIISNDVLPQFPDDSAASSWFAGQTQLSVNCTYFWYDMVLGLIKGYRT